MPDIVIIAPCVTKVPESGLPFLIKGAEVFTSWLSSVFEGMKLNPENNKECRLCVEVKACEPRAVEAGAVGSETKCSLLGF